MIRREIYSPFQIYVLRRVKINIEIDILILAGAMLKVVCILNNHRSHYTETSQ